MVYCILVKNIYGIIICYCYPRTRSPQSKLLRRPFGWPSQGRTCTSIPRGHRGSHIPDLWRARGLVQGDPEGLGPGLGGLDLVCYTSLLGSVSSGGELPKSRVNLDGDLSQPINLVSDLICHPEELW